MERVEIFDAVPGGFSRRVWVQCVTAAVAALAAGGRLAGAEPATGTAGAGLSPAQAATLTAVGEWIVPGSARVGCAQVIDRILAIEDDQHRQALSGALAAFDREAERLHGTGFARLDAAQQESIVAASSEGGPVHEAFRTVKEWTAAVYWTSRDGLKEQGWTGRLAWENFPGCDEHGG